MFKYQIHLCKYPLVAFSKQLEKFMSSECAYTKDKYPAGSKIIFDIYFKFINYKQY